MIDWLWCDYQDYDCDVAALLIIGGGLWKAPKWINLQHPTHDQTHSEFLLFLIDILIDKLFEKNTSFFSNQLQLHDVHVDVVNANFSLS